MKKIIFILAVVFSLTGYALATSVTTKDGNNFNVTNDSGFTASMTNDEINQKEGQYASIAQNDSIKYLADQETALVWGQVQQMANAAYGNYETTQNVQVNSN